jgi:hypothetical protein
LIFFLTSTHLRTVGVRLTMPRLGSVFPCPAPQCSYRGLVRVLHNHLLEHGFGVSVFIMIPPTVSDQCSSRMAAGGKPITPQPCLSLIILAFTGYRTHRLQSTDCFFPPIFPPTHRAALHHHPNLLTTMSHPLHSHPNTGKKPHFPLILPANPLLIVAQNLIIQSARSRWT